MLPLVRVTIAILLSLYYPPSLPSVFLSYAVHSWLFLAHCYLPVLSVLPYLSIYLYIYLFCESEMECKWSACGGQKKTYWHQSSPYTQRLNWSWQTWKQRAAFACYTIGRTPVCLLNPNFHSSPLLWVCPMKRKYIQSKRTIKRSLVWSHQGQEDANTLVFTSGKLLPGAASSCIFQSAQRHFSYAFRWTLLTHRTSHMAKLTHPITKLKIISNLEHNQIVDVETDR